METRVSWRFGSTTQLRFVTAGPAPSGEPGQSPGTPPHWLPDEDLGRIEIGPTDQSNCAHTHEPPVGGVASCPRWPSETGASSLRPNARQPVRRYPEIADASRLGVVPQGGGSEARGAKVKFRKSAKVKPVAPHQITREAALIGHQQFTAMLAKQPKHGVARNWIAGRIAFTEAELRLYAAEDAATAGVNARKASLLEGVTLKR